MLKPAWIVQPNDKEEIESFSEDLEWVEKNLYILRDVSERVRLKSLLNEQELSDWKLVSIFKAVRPESAGTSKIAEEKINTEGIFGKKSLWSRIKWG